jgi:hypothetical protein
MTKGAIKLIICLFILIPIVLYFVVWDYYAINIPKWDDHPLKGFIIEYAHADGWNAKIGALVRQHNEHRIALTRLIAWIDFKLFGSLNYRHLMLAGNMLLLGIIPLWHILLKNNKKPLFALLPIPFLWLSLAQWENMYWGMASIQNFGVVTLTLWTLYLCVNTRATLFALSLPLAIVTIFTSPNGIFVLPIGALLIFLTGNRQRLALWILTAGAGVFFFFNDYVRTPFDPASNPSILQLLKGYMAFLGSFAESFPVLDHFGVCVFIGSFLFLVSVSMASTTLFRIMRNKYAGKAEQITDLFCLGTILFILGTALIVVYRREGFGMEGLITSKYKIYSILLLITAYLYVVIPIRGSFLSPYITAIIALAITFNVFSYHFHLVDANTLRKYLTTSQFNWTYTEKTLKASPDTSFAGSIVAKTPVFYEKWLPLILIADKQGFAGDTRMLTALYDQTSFKSKGDSSLTFSNKTFTSQRLQDSGIYLLLSSNDRFYVFPGYRSRNTNRKELFLKQYYFAPGFSSEISFAVEGVEKGHYKIGILRQQGEQTGVLFKTDRITVKESGNNKIKVNW